MKKEVLIVLICLLVTANLAACGRPRPGQEAPAPMLAVELAATQTAEAPTSAPTSAPTAALRPTAVSTIIPAAAFTPILALTSTPIPAPTLAPPSAPAPSLPAGWQDYAGSGFHIGLPGQWQSVDVEGGGMDAVLSSLQGADAEWAQNIISMFSAQPMQDSIKFWARDSKAAGTGYATAAISLQSQPISVPIDVLCAFLPSVLGQMGFKLVDSECGLTVNGLDAARFVLTLQDGFLTLKQDQYVYVRDGDIWMVSLSVDEVKWSRYEPTFITIAQSFRVE